MTEILNPKKILAEGYEPRDEVENFIRLFCPVDEDAQALFMERLVAALNVAWNSGAGRSVDVETKTEKVAGGAVESVYESECWKTRKDRQ